MPILGKHRVNFQYFDEKIKVKSNNEDITVIRPVTRCMIENLDKEVIAKSTVKLHHNDVDNKILAREFAFRAAVSQIPDKEVRRAIRTAYRIKLRNPQGRIEQETPPRKSQSTGKVIKENKSTLVQKSV